MSFDFGGTTASGGSTLDSVTDADALALAAAGADWQCGSCEASNRGDAPICRQCGTPRSRPSPPPSEGVDPAIPIAAAGFTAAAVVVGGILVVLLCAGFLWLTRPIEVEATVSERTFTRQVDVERLVAVQRTGWKDELPEAASPPGSPQLAAGLGTIHQCATHVCYPRPPDGGRLVEVTGRQWSRTHTVQPMTERTESGWDESVPPASGSWPSGGSGGTEGRYGGPSCHSQERQPQRCRMESSSEACGTEQQCTVRDLGNGFAEEVCTDVTKYCTVQEEVCDPAVYDDWCTWTELHWGPGRSETSSGTMDAPRWPALSAGHRDRLLTEQSNTVVVETLAGTGSGNVSVDDPSLLTYEPGQQYFVSGGVPRRVPQDLRRRGAGPFRDCGTGIPRDKLVNRDECSYDEWIWRADPPLQASAATVPDWPTPDLRDDGRQARTEWATIELQWTRGKSTYSDTVRVSIQEAKRWPPGAVTPVKVSFGGELKERLGDWPDASTAP